jgi:hypothetical protein
MPIACSCARAKGVAVIRIAGGRGERDAGQRSACQAIAIRVAVVSQQRPPKTQAIAGTSRASEDEGENGFGKPRRRRSWPDRRA